jgi:glycosyltransferase involved in cell wall biosynthesis
MSFTAIHQFSPSCAAGDGVTQGALYTQSLLRTLGYASEIYAEHVPTELSGRILSRERLAPDPDSLLLIHHSLGYENDAWLWQLPQAKALVYHNITPESFWKLSDPEFRLSRLGREQLAGWASRVIGALGVSRVNCDELRANGYANIAELPLLTDWQSQLHDPADESVMQQLRGTFNILFVGRIAYNKRQDRLVELFEEYRHFSGEPSRLILAGGVTSQSFHDALIQKIQASGLEDKILLPGKVSAEILSAYYRSAHAYVSLSEHEGFGMPLIEAMAAGIPVIAADHLAVRDTVGEGGFVVPPNTPLREIAALLHLVRQEPEVRARLRLQQRRRLQPLRRDSLLNGLRNWLAALGAEGSPVVETPTLSSAWQVEGPLVGTYSLAAVNRGVARALRQELPVALHPMDGGGDIPISDSEWKTLFGNDGMILWRDLEDIPEADLRFCYPPYANAMSGDRRWIHSYGWEETGFPASYVGGFNRDLDGLTVLSQFVRKTMMDAGVVLPIAVTGAGIDLPALEGRVSPSLPREWHQGVQPGDFVFLHVSSCFPRKGVAELLDAWGRAFTHDDSVVLVIKTFSNPHNTAKLDLAAWRQKKPGYPRVVVIEGDIAEDQMAAMYRSSHAFVMPSRGEGLGLPAAEAMLAGLPVITVAWSGLKDFCNESTAYLCDFDLVYADSHLGTEHSAWAVAHVDHLAQRLREVRKLGPRHSKQQAALEVAQRFSWQRSAASLKKFHRALGEMPLLRPKPVVAVMTTWNVRCGIAEYARHQIQAWPEARVRIMACEDAEGERRDRLVSGPRVYRNWSQNAPEPWAQVLEDCVREGVGAVLIQYNFGFFSLAMLGELCESLRQRGIHTHVVFHATADTLRPEGIQRLEQAASSLALATRLYVHGVDDLNRLKKAGLVDNATLIPHGVPVPASDFEPPAAALRNQRIIASYGFALPHKGLPELVRAFARLKSRDPLLLHLVNAQYPIEESKRVVAELQALVSELNLENQVVLNVNFLPDEESQALLRHADCIVFPYQQTRESASGAIRLALGLEVPVVTTPLPIFSDVREVVHTLEGTDEEAIRKGLQALLDDQALLARHAQRQASWVAARAWPEMSSRLLRIVDSIALNRKLDEILASGDSLE